LWVKGNLRYLYTRFIWFDLAIIFINLISDIIKNNRKVNLLPTIECRPKKANSILMRTQTPSNPTKLQQRLQRTWWLAVIYCISILFGGFWMLYEDWQVRDGLQGLFQAAMVTVYVLILLRIGMPLNYHPRKKVLHSKLGYGTWITITRAMLIAILAGYLFQPWPSSRHFPGWPSWTPGVLYITASLLDYLDGRIARATKHESRLGAFLDINIDALGLLIAPLLAVWYGQLPGAYLSVSAAYYLLVFAIWLRKKYSKPVFKIPPRRSARIVAGFQMGFVGVALLPAISPPLTTMAAYIFMIPLLAGFIKDWMIASGNTENYGPN
jgi:CDP-diacylglycerol--glycerol-3-phosphate 3-phosphatidyltransferase